MKKTAAIIAILALCLSLFSCGEKYDFPESTEHELETILTIGDYEIPFEQYYYFFMNYKTGYDGGDDSYWDKNDPDAAFSEIDESVRESLIRCYAVFSLCDDYDIDYRSGDVGKSVSEAVKDYIENEFGGEEKYLSSIKEAYMNHSVFKFVLTEFECESRLYDALIDAKVIKTDGQSVISAITDGEFCCAKQILIKNDIGDDPAANRELAEQILTQAQLGVDFDSLIVKYGEDPEMIVNPNGRYFTHGELIEEFEEAAFALQIGEISDVVESPVGYHIIMRCEIDEEYVSVNLADLGEAYLTAKFWEAVEKRAESMTVKTTAAWGALSMSDFAY